MWSHFHFKGMHLFNNFNEDQCHLLTMSPCFFHHIPLQVSSFLHHLQNFFLQVKVWRISCIHCRVFCCLSFVTRKYAHCMKTLSSLQLSLIFIKISDTSLQHHLLIVSPPPFFCSPSLQVNFHILSFALCFLIHYRFFCRSSFVTRKHVHCHENIIFFGNFQ